MESSEHNRKIIGIYLFVLEFIYDKFFMTRKLRTDQDVHLPPEPEYVTVRSKFYF